MEARFHVECGRARREYVLMIETVRLLVEGGRAVGVRSAELHIYGVGGAVSDPQHRDMGSLLTLSALLTPPDAFEGATFTIRRGDYAPLMGRVVDALKGAVPHADNPAQTQMLQRYCDDVCALKDVASSTIMVSFFWPSAERGDGEGAVVAPDGSRASMI